MRFEFPIGQGLDDLLDDPPAPEPVSPQMRLFGDSVVAVVEREQVQVVVQPEPVTLMLPEPITDDDIPF